MHAAAAPRARVALVHEHNSNESSKVAREPEDRSAPKAIAFARLAAVVARAKAQEHRKETARLRPIDAGQVQHRRLTPLTRLTVAFWHARDRCASARAGKHGQTACCGARGVDFEASSRTPCFQASLSHER
jgi:hypothetical protein